jgi:hypothetical protein
MADWHLITWLLELDILETHKFRGASRHDKLAFDTVDLAFISRTLKQWVELSLTDDLVDFKATDITHVNSDLHLGLHVR